MDGVSFSVGHVRNFTGKQCNSKNYEGAFIEIGVTYGVGAGYDIGFDYGKGDFTGVNDEGLSIGKPGFKLAWCHYKLLWQTKIDEGCKCEKEKENEKYETTSQ